MITIELKPREITMSGHAGSAPYGQDLVCAASSALITSLAEFMARNEDKLTEHIVNIDRGEAYIKVSPVDGFKDMCDGAFSVITSGFELLSNLHPEYILVKSCI